MCSPISRVAALKVLLQFGSVLGADGAGEIVDVASSEDRKLQGFSTS